MTQEPETISDIKLKIKQTPPGPERDLLIERIKILSDIAWALHFYEGFREELIDFLARRDQRGAP